MTDRSKRVKTLLRVTNIRRKQSEAGLAKAEIERREALTRQAETIERLSETASLPAGTVSSLEARRQRTDLRIDAVLSANQVVAATAEEVATARLRWQAAARDEKAMEELDRREKAVLAIRASRVAERAIDDALRARRANRTTGGQQS